MPDYVKEGDIKGSLFRKLREKTSEEWSIGREVETEDGYVGIKEDWDSLRTTIEGAGQAYEVELKCGDLHSVEYNAPLPYDSHWEYELIVSMDGREVASYGSYMCSGNYNADVEHLFEEIHDKLWRHRQEKEKEEEYRRSVEEHKKRREFTGPHLKNLKKILEDD